MSEMQQGEEYEEEEYNLEEGEEAEYDEESDLEIDTIYGIPKKTVYLAGAAILVVIILVGVIMSWRKSSNNKTADDSYDDNDYLDYTEEVDIDLDDIYGTSDDYEDYEDYEDYSYMSLSDITTEETEELRRLGYTGDEIELAIEYGLNYQELVNHATELRDQEAKDALARMSDTAGPEFKELLNYTFMGQTPYPSPSGDRDQYKETKASVKINSDYVKCPVRGNQLWLKCHIATDAYVWYQCPPVRWLNLPDSGNIVLNIDFYLLNDDAYVVGISEADSSLDSIDASEHSFAEVTDDEGNAEESDENAGEEGGGAAFLTE